MPDLPRASVWLVLTAGILTAGALGRTAARAEDAKPPTPASPASRDLATERARRLVACLADREIARRDAAMSELLALASAEDDGTGPRPVHQVLVEALRHPDAEVRFRARRVLGDPELRVGRALETLLKVLPTEEVHAARHALFGKADHAGVRGGLVRIARRAARAGLRTQEEEWRPYGLCGGDLQEQPRFVLALDLLAELVSTEDDVRAVADLLHERLGGALPYAIDALAARRDLARPVLRDLLHDQDATAREQAALALGGLGTAEDAAALEALIQDRSPRVRRAIVSAFLVLPLEPARCARVASLAADPDPRVAAAGLHLGSARGLPFVREAAEKVLASEIPANATEEQRDGYDLAQREAARALGRLGAQGVGGLLAPWTQKGGRIASCAAWGLGATGELENAGLLEKLLERDDLKADPAVYYGLARAGATDLLLRLVKTGQDEQRRCALEALGSARGDPDAIEKQLEAAATRALDRGRGPKDWNDFSRAFCALRDRNDAGSRAALGRLLDRAAIFMARGADHSALKRAIEWSQEVWSGESLRAIEQFLDAPGGGGEVAATAADALATIDPARARVVLARKLDQNAGDMMRAIYARSLARAGDRTKVAISLETSRAQLQNELAHNLDGDSIRFYLNTLGIDETYAGHTDEALLCFRRMLWIKPDNNVAPYNLACVHSLAGHTEDALRWLRQSLCQGFRDWRHIEGDADLLHVNKDPRFLRLIEEMRLEQEIEPAPSGGE